MQSLSACFQNFRIFAVMHILQYIHWDQDPSIFGLPFRWYGLLFASSFFFGYILMKRIFFKEGVPEQWLESLTIYMALSTVIGARLGHCLFYDPGYYLSHPIEILKVWEGGLASHGAAIGIITGLILWSRRVSKRSVLWVLDRIVIMVALSGLTIRSGNLMNSEILGKETTASYGFVFPRADQGEALRAKWEGEKVALTYSPTAIREDRVFEFYRTADDTLVQRLSQQDVLIPGGKSAKAVQLVDQQPGTRAHIRYFSAELSTKAPLVITNGDSLNLRTATFQDPFAEGKLAFGGRWEQDRVHLRFDMRGLISGAATRGTLLLRSNGDGNWQVIHRGVLGGPNTLVLDTLDFPAGITNPQYRLVVKEDETLLIARHPAQIYEAVAYTIIFVFLLWLYYRKDGKLPLGQHFGLFLVMVFLMRFLIEFGKEEQAEFLVGSPLNMGQLLSIPFVLAGLFFILRSIRNPQFPPAMPTDTAAEVPSTPKSRSK
jgi:prolipoprotein diacylglyceryl transferase